MKCLNCAVDNPAGNSFCTSCGSPLISEGGRRNGGWNSLPFYTRVSITGLLVVALVLSVVTILSAIQNGADSELVQGFVFYVLFMIPTVASIVLAWRKQGGWALVAPVWALVLLLINAPLVPNALGSFDSFFDGGLLIPVYGSLIVVGVTGSVGVLQRRRGNTREISTASERWILSTITMVVIGLMVLSGALHLNSIESVAPDEKATAISIEMKNSAFEPAQLTVSAGKPAKFVIKNRDLTMHTFTIEELGIDVKVLPGSEELIELDSLPAGTYTYRCTYGAGFSLPLHKPEVESDPSVPSDEGQLVVQAS